MNVEPYEPISDRRIRQWTHAAVQIGVHVITLQEVYLDKWFRTMEPMDFLERITKKIEFCNKILEACKLVKLTESELEQKENQWHEALEDENFDDLLNFRLKKIIEVGDQWQAHEDETFGLSGRKYVTKGNLYTIQWLRDEEGSGFAFGVATDIPEFINTISHHGIRSLWRNGKEIWSWNKAYLNLWLELNPNHPQTQIMIDHLSG